MINVRELRIGNNVSTGSENAMTVAQIAFRYGDDTYDIKVARTGTPWIYGYTDAELSPIPLTNEVLEKCGFKQWEDGITWELNTPNGFIHIVGTAFHLGGEHSCTNMHTFLGDHGLKCLHQLQNLYYSLTGTELTVNL